MVVVTLAVFASLALLPLSQATADTIMFSDSVALQPTNFNSSVSVPKFNPALGTLTKVIFELSGHVEGQAKFESLDAGATTISMQLAAQVKLQRPDLSSLVVAFPLAMTSDNASAFDGVMDFGGTSGKTYPALAGDDNEMSMTTAPLDLALFTGMGNIMLPVMATGASSGSGAGNLLLQFNTSASSDVTVTYEYTVIPEPATAMLVSLGALGLFRRRR
jgi:hypothetical protein